MKIDNVVLKPISDSRGEPTIEIGIKTGSGEFSAQIPSGKSRGSREAAVLPPKKAGETLEIFKKEIIGKDFKNIKDFDGSLVVLDGTPNKAKLGGNLMLGLSLAFARALAKENNFELWQILRSEFFPASAESEPPRIFSNFIGGGVHAKNNLAIQEFWVVAESKGGAAETCRKLLEFYESVGRTLKEQYGLSELKVGDEKAYSLDFRNNFEPVEVLGREIEKNRLTGEFSLGLDAAASSFYKDGLYVFEGKKLTSSELEGIYSDYFRKAPLLFSIEDPFDERDEAGFTKFSASWGSEKLVIGDDLTVTDPELIEAAAAGKMVGGIIIKPNQIGTVSETCAAMNAAHENGLKCVVSNRSGETMDNFLIHFAKAGGAYAVKIGAPAGERLLKFQEFVRLYS